MKTLRIALAVSFVLSVTHGVRAQTSCPDWSSSFGLPGLSTIRGMTTFDDGSGLALYISAPLTVDGVPQLVGHGILRWNGTTWSAPGTNLTSASARRFFAFDDGGGLALYAAGSFTLSGLSQTFPVVRWDGIAWSEVGGSPFPTNSTWGGTDLAAFDDGGGPKLYLSTNHSAGGVQDPDNNVWRLDGTTWTPLSNGATNGVYALEVFDGGSGPRLVAGGSFEQIGSTIGNGTASWDGSSWSTLGTGFGPPNYDVVNALTIFDFGNGPVLVAGGFFGTAGGIPAENVAQWDGASWSFVGNGAPSVITCLLGADLGSGPLLFAGGYAEPSTPHSLLVLDGKNWIPVGGDVNNGVNALSVFDAGHGSELFVGGYFTQAGGIAARSFVGWDGTSFHATNMISAGADRAVHALRALDLGSGTSLYAGGDFTICGDAAANGVARWDGAHWHGFGLGVAGSVQAIGAFDDGTGPSLIVGGQNLQTGNSPLPSVARFDGAQWLPLSTGTDGGIRALETFDDGSGPALYAGGTFTHAGGANIAGLARWNGSAWSQVGSGVTDWVYALAVFDDGTGSALYAGGRYIGVLKWDGSTWTSIGALGVAPVVYALHVWDDGSGPALYASGKFTASGGSNIAKLVGGSWISLASGADKIVTSMTDLEDANGRGLFVTGYFDVVGGQAIPHVARWDGASFSSLGATFSGTNPAWDAIAAFDDGASGGPDLFVGGSFDHVGSTASSNIAKWESCSVATPFCFGDGSGATCPCVNSGIAGHGCENSSATGGALLRATGSAAKDDVVLIASGERPTALSIFLQGNASIAPLIFGDGLRCTGGALKRLYSKNAVGGAASAPGASDLSIRARSAALGDTIPAGAMRYYQTYYRDPVAGFCPPPRGNLWNVTNGLQIRW
jgi:hypothetical protein